MLLPEEAEKKLLNQLRFVRYSSKEEALRAIHTTNVA